MFRQSWVRMLSFQWHFHEPPPHCAVPRASEGLKPAVWSVAVVHGYYRLLTKQLNPVVYLKTEINESE